MQNGLLNDHGHLGVHYQNGIHIWVTSLKLNSSIYSIPQTMAQSPNEAMNTNKGLKLNQSQLLTVCIILNAKHFDKVTQSDPVVHERNGGINKL